MDKVYRKHLWTKCTVKFKESWNNYDLDILFGVINCRATALFTKTREEIGTKLLIQGQELGSHVGKKWWS